MSGLEKPCQVSLGMKRVAPFSKGGHFVEGERAAAFENVEALFHFEVAVRRDAGAAHDLLGSDCEIRRAGGGTKFDEDVAAVAEVNEMFAFGGCDNTSLWRGGRWVAEGGCWNDLGETEGGGVSKEGSPLEVGW